MFSEATLIAPAGPLQTCVEKLAQLFPSASPVRIPVRVMTLSTARRPLQEQTVIEFGTRAGGAVFFHAAAGVRRRGTRGEFGWIAGRARHGRSSEIPPRTEGGRCPFCRGSGQLDHKTMTLKSNVTTLKPPANAQAAPGEFAAQWSEARDAYPLYAALATQFNLAPLPHPEGELPPVRPTARVFDSDLKWLDGSR